MSACTARKSLGRCAKGRRRPRLLASRDADRLSRATSLVSALDGLWQARQARGLCYVLDQYCWSRSRRHCLPRVPARYSAAQRNLVLLGACAPSFEYGGLGFASFDFGQLHGEARSAPRPNGQSRHRETCNAAQGSFTSSYKAGRSVRGVHSSDIPTCSLRARDDACHRARRRARETCRALAKRHTLQTRRAARPRSASQTLCRMPSSDTCTASRRSRRLRRRRHDGAKRGGRSSRAMS